MTDPVVILDRQVGDGVDAHTLPSASQIDTWLTQVFLSQDLSDKEITVRFVAEDESAELNGTYRNKPKPTNVLSFPFESIPGVPLPLLGDLVICAPVIERESVQQNKSLSHHYAHMIIHGCLHLLGFDHIDDNDAQQMEALEISLLAHLGIDDPYQEF